MRKKKILIIEDDIVFAKDIERIVKNLRYYAFTLVASKKEIFPVVNRLKPDLVLINIELGETYKRIDIAKRIRAKLDIPIVLVTDSSEKRIVKMAQKTEPFGCILKPVNERTLYVAIEMAFARHAMEKRYEEKITKALRQSEDRLQQLLECIGEGIVFLDSDGIVTSVNEKFLDMIGHERHDVIDHPIREFLGDGCLRKSDEHKTNLDEDRWKPLELAWKRIDGKQVYTIYSRRPIQETKGRAQGIIAVLTDITDRREAEMELRRSHQELLNLSHHLQSVREKESKRIAGEIHDELGQKLTALKMDLSWLSNRIFSIEKCSKEIPEKIESMSGLIDETIQTVQKISAELRPGLLDDLGLVPAIEWLAQDFQNRTNIICKTHLHCNDIDLDPDCSTAIFRISQEALTNVARHAKATRVDIILKNEKKTLTLRVSDNGRGIREDEVYSQSSLGLMGMRERVRPFGGELLISGIHRKGTTLTVTLPLESC